MTNAIFRTYLYIIITHSRAEKDSLHPLPRALRAFFFAKKKLPLVYVKNFS